MGIALPQRRLVSQNDQSMVEAADVPRSRFQNQWSLKTAFNAGWLVPIEVEEVYPGDHFSYEVTAMVRMATPLFPILDSQRIDTFFFFVPARLLWENWEEFHGYQPLNPTQTIGYTIPQIVSPVGGWAVGSLYDYFGIPTVGQIDGAETISINALPLRAYKMIYREWFQDQNIDSIANALQTGNGPDAEGLYAMVQRRKSHDYFTSCLPWAQKFTAPTVALGGLAPIIGIGISDVVASGVNGNFFETPPVGEAGGSAVAYTNRRTDLVMDTDLDGSDWYPAVYADLSEATGVAINTFRLAYMTQQLLERDARGGTRYTESIWSHFRVRNPDFRLQRPEYIGGGQSPLTITPIAQTGVDSADAGLGSLGGAGTAVGQHRASYAATEHGYIIGLINVKTELSYQQGLRKLWSRSTRYDLFYPSFAQLGEQAVLSKEIYCDGTAGDDDVFGYQERFHELRTRVSQVTGIMRSTASGTIDAWHFAQDFSARPTLNSTFLIDSPDMARVLAAGSLASGQQYLADILFRRTVVRPLPMYGTPALLGRF